MARNAALPVALLFTALCTAQVSITDNEMPHAGDDLTRTRAYLNPLLDYATTGAAQVWDFSGLQANSQATTSYQTVASTNFIYALAYADVFFNPNRANVARPGVDIAFSGLLPIANPFTFTYRNSAQYRTVGFGAELGGIPVPIIFNDPDVIYELPVAFSDTSNSVSSWEVSLPTLFHYGFLQDRTNMVDGWGAITTPAGTFDVLRVKTDLLGRDTIALDSLSIGFTIDRPVVHEYKWLAENLRVPVLQVNTTEIFGFEVITDIWFYDEPRSIEVVPPLAGLCPGSTLLVNYEATGVFNTGSFLIPANVFTAQLSDSTGDFANAVDIGSVTSTVSGSILATIPAGTPLGGGYRIRVVSSSPAFTGTDNGIDLVVGEPPIASIDPGASGFCSGATLTLNAVGGPGYQWQMDGSDIVGATSDTYTTGAGGEFRVIVSNGCGTDTSDAMLVTAYDLPEFTLADDSVLTCDGTPVTLTGLDLSGQSPLSFQWYLDGIAVLGEVDSTISATLPGDYSLEVSNPNTGCSFTTAPANLAVESVATPIVIPSDTTVFCEGGSLVLDAGSDPGLSYQWAESGSDLTGETANTMVVISSGAYTVEVTTANGCNATSDPLDVTVNPLPPTPLISQSGDTLYSSGSGSFQWFVGGVAIAGADTSWLVPDSSGVYSVVVTDTNGCGNSSDPYTYISTGINTFADADLLVVPNPSNGQFTIRSVALAGQRFEVTAPDGTRVLNGAFSGVVTHMDLGSYASGLYLLKMYGAHTMSAVRLVLAK